MQALNEMGFVNRADFAGNDIVKLCTMDLQETSLCGR